MLWSSVSGTELGTQPAPGKRVLDTPLVNAGTDG